MRSIFKKIQESVSLVKKSGMLGTKYFVLADYIWRENICVHNPFHKIFHPRENWILTVIKELAWDTSSTENFWLDIHSYKDPVENFPFQLFSLGVQKNALSSYFECIL